MTDLIKNYAPKYAQDMIEDISKDMDGYDIMLKRGYFFTDTESTIRIEPTLSELKKVFKFIEKATVEDMYGMGYKDYSAEQAVYAEADVADKEITEKVKELLLEDGTKLSKKALDNLDEVIGQVFVTGDERFYIEREYRVHEYLIKPIEKVTGMKRASYNARKPE